MNVYGKDIPAGVIADLRSFMLSGEPFGCSLLASKVRHAMPSLSSSGVDRTADRLIQAARKAGEIDQRQRGVWHVVKPSGVAKES